jgi:hypothetical protein
MTCITSAIIAAVYKNIKRTNKLAVHFAKNRSNDNYHPSFLKIKSKMESQKLKINMDDTAKYNSDLTAEEFDSALRDCDGSSPGPDQIEYELIKQLTRFEHRSTSYGRRAPSPKVGSWLRSSLYQHSENVESNRPIALTSCLYAN